MNKENTKVTLTKIYYAISKMDERYNNPSKWFKKCYLKRDDIIHAVQAKQKTKRETPKSVKAAEEEFERKMKWNKYQQKMREQQVA